MHKIRNRDDGRVHFSELKAMARSPAHYVHACARERKPSAAMQLGSIVDRLVLGGRYTVWDGGIRRGKAWDTFQAQHAGEEIYTREQERQALRCADAVKADPVASRLIGAYGVEFQRVMAWELAGLDCGAGIAGKRGGFDVLSAANGFIADLKVTTDTHPDRWQRQAWRMHYHAQLAFYVDGARALGMPIDDAYLIGVESGPPNAVTVLHLGREILEEGRKSIRLWIERLKQCEEADDWPSYTQSAVEFTVPSWLGLETAGEDEEG